MDGQRTLPWYQMRDDDVIAKLNSDKKNGLSDEGAAERLKKYGNNAFSRHKKKTLLQKIAAQVKSPLMLILIGAGLATLLLGHTLDTVVIAIVVAINIVIGILQENRADDAFEKLISSQEKHATVVRGGQREEIAAQSIVPGDVIVIEAGMYIPADARLLSEKELTINESSLTGEWEEVHKKPGVLEKESVVSDQTNMVWMGTLATSGSGRALVVNTGGHTQIGVIAESLASGEEDLIPLQKNIRRLAKILSAIVIAIIVTLFVLGVVRGQDFFDMLLISIAIAVAVIPSGLPAAVTVVLALGMEAMLKRGGLVRNLLAAETLGNTTVIMTDKTGTLTKAKMQISDIISERSLLKNNLRRVTSRSGAFTDTDKRTVLIMSMLTSDAYVEGAQSSTQEWIVRGRPVERAVVYAGLESGLKQDDLLTEMPRLDYIPFDSGRRYTASLHRIGDEKSKKRRVYIAGAPEYLLEQAHSVFSDNQAKRLTKQTRTNFESIQRTESERGMRIIGVAYTDVNIDSFDEFGNQEEITQNIFDGIVFCGFLNMHDPIRADVPEAIKTAHEAGTHVIMVTGDNPITALKIAQEAGVAGVDDIAVTGTDISRMDDHELSLTLKKRNVFSRVLPQQKLRIARLLKSQGEVVAMTGDGVNDAPALRNADIGIALGSGTEVAKEASDLILLNDSFSIIITAIEEGRRIRDNLKKIITYLLSTSFSELFVVSTAVILATPLPILPTQILWIKIVEETFMNFSFAFEPGEDDLMKRDPRKRSMKQILTPEITRLITLIAVITGVFLITLFLGMYYYGISIETIRTIMFIALSTDSIFFTFSIKNLHKPIWKENLLDNKFLLFALGGSLFALVLALEVPALQKLLSLGEVSAKIYPIMLLIGLANLATIEFAKYMVFKSKIK